MIPEKEATMIEIKVPDMTCNHCVSTITGALAGLDATARVEVLLPDHLVRVESKAAPQDVLHCIAEAGYTPQAA